ncbi:MAG: ankyrin repeat domain-containing protein [Rickettsiales bacterium]|jgi:ankyrin repeat protein|nr:ankyrin repeat domain-containing protein [Rickettsiales bacterium]
MTEENEVVIEGEVLKDEWFISAINGEENKLKKLYKENRGRQDENGCTALMYCASSGRADCVKMLIKSGKEELKRIDNSGRTALMYAAINGHEEVVKILVKLEGGIFDNEGKTAYNHAVENGNAACQKILQDTDGGDETKDAKEENIENKKKLDNLQKANSEAQKEIDGKKQKKGWEMGV